MQLYPAQFAAQAGHAVAELHMAAVRCDTSNSDDEIVACARALDLDGDLSALRRCMCIPAIARTSLLPGATTSRLLSQLT